MERSENCGVEHGGRGTRDDDNGVCGNEEEDGIIDLFVDDCIGQEGHGTSHGTSHSRNYGQRCGNSGVNGGTLALNRAIETSTSVEEDREEDSESNTRVTNDI